MRRLLILMSLFASLLVATNAQAQITKLVVNSPAGDYVGQGQSYVLMPVDGNFHMETNFQSIPGVSFFYHNGDYSRWWQIDFCAPNGGPLQIGQYVDARRYGFQPSGHPGFQAFADSRGCNTLVASFEIKALTYDTNGAVASFWATAAQNCEGFMPTLQLELMYNMDAQVPTRTRTWGSLKSIYR